MCVYGLIKRPRGQDADLIRRMTIQYMEMVEERNRLSCQVDELRREQYELRESLKPCQALELSAEYGMRPLAYLVGNRPEVAASHPNLLAHIFEVSIYYMKFICPYLTLVGLAFSQKQWGGPASQARSSGPSSAPGDVRSA